MAPFAVSSETGKPACIVLWRRARNDEMCRRLTESTHRARRLASVSLVRGNSQYERREVHEEPMSGPVRALPAIEWHFRIVSISQR